MHVQYVTVQFFRAMSGEAVVSSFILGGGTRVRPKRFYARTVVRQQRRSVVATNASKTGSIRTDGGHVDEWGWKNECDVVQTVRWTVHRSCASTQPSS